MHTLPKLVAGLLLLSGSIGGAHAAAISTDQWYAFKWDGEAPAPAVACQGGCTLLDGAIDAPVDSPWTIDGPVILRITDAFLAIDQFEVFDNLVSVGITSAFSGSVSSCGPSVEDCFSDSDFSHGTFALGGGLHSITISTVVGSSESGAAYFRVESVPEPATLALLGLGLAGIGAVRRKRLAA